MKFYMFTLILNNGEHKLSAKIEARDDLSAFRIWCAREDVQEVRREDCERLIVEYF